MARQRPHRKRPDRSRLQTVISGEVHAQVDLYCAHYGLTESQFFEAAAREKIDGTGDGKKLGQQLKLLNEQLEILSEHQHLFMQMWLRNTQLFTKQEQLQARAPADALFERFERQIQTNLRNGAGYLARQREAKGGAAPAARAPRVTQARAPSAGGGRSAGAPRRGRGTSGAAGGSEGETPSSSAAPRSERPLEPPRAGRDIPPSDVGRGEGP